MIERYSLPEMKRIWEPENRLRKWLEIEIAACEAWAQLGKVPAEALHDIQTKADFNIDRIDEIEKVTRHDVIAFLTNVAEFIGDAGKYLHLGMTSSDVLDTALALQMKEAAELILGKLMELEQVLAEKARQYKDTLMIGRTHGVHAEPITFGLKMALWVTEVRRARERLEQAKQDIAVGKISGAVGTFANVPPEVEEYVCRKLGLTPAPVSSQIIQRDRHAFYMTTLAVLASSLDKFATEIRHLQRTEVLEAEEPFAEGQKGSSAMPHKRNPVMCERISGLARIVRSNAVAALENVPLWHERDISHSSVERIIIPDSTMAVYYMLVQMIKIMKGLNVYQDRMKENMKASYDLIFSQRVLLGLVEKGASREDAYRLVQRNAMQAWKDKISFRTLVSKDQDILEYLSPEELDVFFDFSYHMKHLDEIFKRAGI